MINLQLTDDEILSHFKDTDFRTRIHGVPLDVQAKMNLLEDDEKEVNDDNLTARAILVKIFASDLIPITGDDRGQLSRMFCRTFAISTNTKIELLVEEACKYWGVLISDYSLFYVGEHGLEEVNQG